MWDYASLTKLITEKIMSATQTGKPVRILTYILGIAGVVMLVLGISIYGVAAAELGSQRITVAALDPGHPGSNAGKPVHGPFTALSQVKAITHHLGEASQTATGGTKDPTTGVVTGGDETLTYGTAPSFTLDAQGNCVGDLALWTDPAGQGTIQCTKGSAPQVTGSLDAKALSGLRGTLTTGSFLIASLFVSVLAFGVAALIAALGAVFILITVMHLLSAKQAVRAASQSATE